MLVGATLSVAACAHDYDCGQPAEEPCPCEQAVAPAPVPAPQPCYECARAPQAPCQGEVRTVREPVEVVYKRTTYGTVYEPRHFENVAYERQSVNGAAYSQAVVEQTAAVSEQEYVVQTQTQPVAPSKKYTAPVVIVPVQ